MVGLGGGDLEHLDSINQVEHLALLLGFIGDLRLVSASFQQLTRLD